MFDINLLFLFVDWDTLRKILEKQLWPHFIIVTNNVLSVFSFVFFLKKREFRLCFTISLQVIKPGKVHLQSTPSSSLPKAKIKTLKMTCVIVSVFLICGLPYFILEMIYNFGDHRTVCIRRKRCQKAGELRVSQTWEISFGKPTLFVCVIILTFSVTGTRKHCCHPGQYGGS